MQHRKFELYSKIGNPTLGQGVIVMKMSVLPSECANPGVVGTRVLRGRAVNVDLMANREIREDNDVEESTTLIRAGVSGARLKTANTFPPDTPRVRIVAAVQAAAQAGPKSDEFAVASIASTPAAMPVASSGMAGPYHLALEIASGGMATVFLAVHGLEGFQNTVAVKRIHPHLAKDKQFVDMFVDEAHIAARINHPYVCRVFDFGKSKDNSYYIAMEFLRGEPLSRVFKTLTPERVANARHPTVIARLIANLAEGLHAAHTLKDTHGQCLDVVHRDITPQNLFVLCDGTVRVTDFGIARARVRSHQTEGGRIKGKLSYMSPEQLNQQTVDCRSDLWGLGVVTWELLTGRRLFRASSEGETVLSVLSRPIPPPSRFAGSVPRQLDAIVLRALSRDPELRYSSARELARALETFLAASGDTVPTMDVAEWMEDLFPGGAKRSDGLIELAHAVLPPERRQSQRPSAMPAGSATPTSQAATPTPRTKPLSLPVVSEEEDAVFQWTRALRIGGAVLAGLIGVLLIVRGAQRHAPPGTAQATPVQTTVPTETTLLPKAPLAAPVNAAPVDAAPVANTAPVANAASVVNTADAPEQPEKTVLAEQSAANAKAAPRRVQPAAAAPAVSAASRAAGSERTGSVQVNTKNGRAEVYVGGRLLGTTPLTLDLPPGPAALTLKPLGGGEPRSVTVVVVLGAMSFITVPLTVPTAAAN
jgi:eukaryotic-like serine/threonine-protein kinase